MDCLQLFPQQRAAALLERIFGDLADVAQVVGYKPQLVGYKPQLVRSCQGFITAFELQKGNPADSDRLVPLVDQHIANTAVRPVSAWTTATAPAPTAGHC